MTRQRRVTLIAAVCVVVLVVGGLVLYLIPFPQKGVAWAKALEVRNAPALDPDHKVQLAAISCAAPGNCSAVGSYPVRTNHYRPVVEDETNGVWSRAEVLTGQSARDEGSNTGAYVVSCSAPGNCSAGGTYSVSRNRLLIFVVNEVKGVWGPIITVPSVTARKTSAYLSSISCPTSGDCSAGGYVTGTGGTRAFALNEVDGTWGRALEIPGTASYSMIGSRLESISCTAPGECSAGGNNEAGRAQAMPFVVNEVHGFWGRAKAVPGLRALSPGGSDYEVSISCSRAGDCAARGNYLDASKVTQAFVVNENKGVWGSAFAIPGMIALNGHHISELLSISCAARGECSAGGTYGTGSHEQAFVIDETHGTWGDPIKIPGLTSLSQGNFPSVTAVSCASSSSCGAIGSFSGPGGYTQVFATNEMNGQWGNARAIGAPSFAGAIGASASTISCSSPKSCVVIGIFYDAKQVPIPFVQGTQTKS
jgi:hypothetical protein